MAARRLLKDVGKAGAGELACGTEKAGLMFESGGLNRLPDGGPLDKSAAAGSSPDFGGPAPKVNCVAALLLPSPASTNVNAAAGLLEESLASSPWPTRSPEKMPRVSPPAVFGGCGSILRVAVVEVGLAPSPDAFGAKVGDPVPRLGELDFEVKENVSSPLWPNVILPFPKENLLASFTGETRERKAEI